MTVVDFRSSGGFEGSQPQRLAQDYPHGHQGHDEHWQDDGWSDHHHHAYAEAVAEALALGTADAADALYRCAGFRRADRHPCCLGLQAGGARCFRRAGDPRHRGRGPHCAGQSRRRVDRPRRPCRQFRCRRPSEAAPVDRVAIAPQADGAERSGCRHGRAWRLGAGALAPDRTAADG